MATDSSGPEGGALLVLIGAPGSGKTKIGKRVARLLGADFVDTDAVIVSNHGAITEIFERHGEPHFRGLEKEAVAAALGRPAIVSLGGGAVLAPDTQAALLGHRVALLTITPEAVALRLSNNKGKRPLVDGLETWQRLAEQRRPIYERLATRSWDTSARPIDAIAQEIADWLSAELSNDTTPTNSSTPAKD